MTTHRGAEMCLRLKQMFKGQEVSLAALNQWNLKLAITNDDQEVAASPNKHFPCTTNYWYFRLKESSQRIKYFITLVVDDLFSSFACITAVRPTRPKHDAHNMNYEDNPSIPWAHVYKQLRVACFPMLQSQIPDSCVSKDVKSDQDSENFSSTTRIRFINNNQTMRTSPAARFIIILQRQHPFPIFAVRIHRGFNLFTVDKSMLTNVL